MEKYKTPLKIAALAVLCLLLLVCVRIGRSKAAASSQYPAIPANAEDFQRRYAYLVPTARDLEDQLPPSVKDIDLSSVNGDLVLSEGGDYRLTGKLRGGIHINAPEDHVHLFLDEADVQAIYGAALYCENADKLVITLLPGTENKFSDSGNYSADGEAEACVYSACSLTLNGGGNLTVNGLYKDGIRSKDLLKLLGTGEYTLRCKRTALHGSDGIYAGGGLYYVSSEKYGLKTTKKGADGRGNLVVAGGSWNLLVGRYSFVTTMADLVIYGCEVRHKSVIAMYDVGGRSVIDQGCVK